MAVGVRTKTVCKGMGNDTEVGVSKGCNTRREVEECRRLASKLFYSYTYLYIYIIYGSKQFLVPELCGNLHSHDPEKMLEQNFN